MVDFMGALSAAGTAIDIAKELNRINKDFDAAELKLRIGELSGSLSTVQIALADAQREIANKDAELERIKKNIEKQPELFEKNGFMYDTVEGEPKGVPYCSRCWTKDKELMRLAHSYGPRGHFKCPQCEADYRNVAEYR